MICTRRILVTSVLLLLVSAVLGFSGSINLSTGVSRGATYTVVEQSLMRPFFVRISAQRRQPTPGILAQRTRLALRFAMPSPAES